MLPRGRLGGLGKILPRRSPRRDRVGFRARVIDLHCHVLPGIDDGPPTIEDALLLASAAAAAGTRTLVATSHVSWEYPNRAAAMGALVR